MTVMAASEMSTEVLAPLSGAHMTGAVTLLLGAGASVTSGLPGWDEFAQALLVQSGAVRDEALAEHLVREQDAQLVAEAAKAAADPERWPAVLSNALYGREFSPAASPLHLAVANYRLGAGEGRTRLATLNFDVLLEIALLDVAPGRGVFAISDRAPHDTSAVEVHHLHGLVLADSITDVVLTLTEYSAILDDPAPWQLQYVRDAVDEGALVIAGTSYRDPDLRRWLHTSLAARSSEHPAVVLLAREAFHLDKSAWSELELALTQQWQAVGLTPVLLQDHADAAQAIRELPHLAVEGYVSPQGRSQAVWAELERGFVDHQKTFQEILHAQAVVLREELGVVNLNLTLWICDGTGDLARFASHDRLTLSRDDLHRVSVGHDSPAVAGVAVGREQQIAEDLGTDGREERRWKSVLAMPVTLSPAQWPYFVGGAITVGLPEALATLSGQSWQTHLGQMADDWGARLSGFLS